MAEVVDSISISLSEVLTIEEATLAARVFGADYPDGASAEYIFDCVRMKITLDARHG